MDKYAIIKIGPAQYKVHEGDNLTVRKQDDGVSADVLLYSDGKEVVLGAPMVENAHVYLKVVEHKRGEKIAVSRFKSKSRYRKTKGYRDELTVLHVEKIEFGEKKQGDQKEPKATEKEIKEEKKELIAQRMTTKSAKPRKEVEKIKKGSK
ncbi:MAG: hypothetical protein KatS3mg101_0752 [Patescibacteria group bacterium]|nr:MAG: hypothetical protein KatS3mg101_0752 [Patescibacteria group bacterium]